MRSDYNQGWGVVVVGKCRKISRACSVWLVNGVLWIKCVLYCPAPFSGVFMKREDVVGQAIIQQPAVREPRWPFAASMMFLLGVFEGGHFRVLNSGWEVEGLGAEEYNLLRCALCRSGPGARPAVVDDEGKITFVFPPSKSE